MMSISAIAGPASSSATQDAANVSNASADDDGTTSSFAGILAAAMHAPAPKPIAKASKDGTSDLDHPASGADDASHPTTTGDSKLAADKTDDSAAAATTNVIRSIAFLDPALQAKLSRVIARVRAETGHDVSVAETYRSQARQNALYAQGRDTAGPIVTWTQHSKHTQGRAVDLLLDGGAADPSAYEALQRIAQEEGLHTLGLRDPGHLELPGRAGATSAIPAEPADPSGLGGGQVSIARVAQLAPVARLEVAQVAQVAQVARVATPASRTAGSSIPTNATPKVTSGVASGGQAAAAQGKDGRSGSQFDSSSSDRDGTSGGGSSESGQRGGYAALGAAFSTGAGLTSGGSHDVPATAASTAAERTARVLAAIEDAPARPLSQITMSLDAGNGAIDRIQVALRGDSLSTAIDAADPRAAHAMSVRSDELVRALTKDGAQLDALQIRAANTSTAAASAAAQSSQSGNSSGSSPNSSFQRADAWHQQQDRQRSQRGWGEDRRQQQRNQRGGQDQ